jgi:hypothetical protein
MDRTAIDLPVFMKQKSRMSFLHGSIATAVALSLTLGSTKTDAASYASSVSIAGTTVTFILNEPADALSYSINGGAPTFIDGTTNGLKTFNLTSASDTFSITAAKNDPIGYTIPTGVTASAIVNGLSQPTNEGGFRLISDDTNILVRFNSPRGVSVAADPNNPQFGTAYISNSAAATTTTGTIRTLGDGLYALRANQSDAFGFGDTAVPTGFEGSASANSPFRLHVGGDHNLYIADFSDANGGVLRMSGSLSGSTQVLAGIGGPTSLPVGQNHGSTTGVVVSPSPFGITLYTVDEDLTSGHFNGTTTTDRNSLWRYDIDNSPLPYAGVPTKLASVLVPGATSDLDRSQNGNFYLAQNRANGLEGGIIVLSSDGSTVLFNSLTESRVLLGNPTAIDIFRNVVGLAVSHDQSHIAALLNNSDVAVMPLDGNGIPIITDRLVINTGADITSGRDIAFDAAGNIHYVSSGQGLYRVFSPGGVTEATTSWNGASYEFVLVPEPSSALMVGLSAFLLARRRTRNQTIR